MYKSKIHLILFFFVLNINKIFTQTANDGWFWQYPKPQGNTLRDIFIFDSSKAIAVGDLGTVIKTYNGGKSWNVQHHAGGTDIDLYSVHFTDTLNGWACGGIWYTDKNVLIKTIDAGKSWEEVKTDNKLPLNGVYFVDVDTGFVVGEDGIILKTTNAGITWDIRKIDDYVGYGWLDVFRLKAITFTDKQTGWIVGAGFYGNEIFKTTDCGKTWMWNEGIILLKFFGSINDICFINENYGYITGDLGFFARTNDGGITWKSQDLSEKYQKIEYQYFNSICFTDTANGWIVGGNGTVNDNYGGVILQTHDGGNNWINADSTKMYGQLYKLRFKGKNKSWIIGQSGLIYITTNAGENWIAQREKKYGFSSIYFIDENTGWAVGDSGVIMHTENGGTDWIKQNQNDSLLFNCVFAIDNQNVFVVGSILDLEYIPTRVKNAILLSSTNEGIVWKKRVFDSLYSFNSIFFIDDSIGWITGNELLKTTDQARTWNKITSDVNKPTRNLQFINKDVGWGTLYGGYNILKTNDGGKSWKSVCIDSTFTVNSFHFINADLGWAAGVGHDPNSYYWDKYIYKTTDGGNSWMLCPDVPMSVYNSIYFINENTGWACGGYIFEGPQFKSSIIKTMNGGDNWIEQQSPPSNKLNEVFFINNNIGWTIGDGIIKTIDGGGTVNVKEIFSYIAPKNLLLYQNYPNPFNPRTIISYQLSVSSFVTIKIYDILGREVETLVNKYEKAGNYSVGFNANRLTSGIYFYCLIAGKRVITKKMILLR